MTYSYRSQYLKTAFITDVNDDIFYVTLTFTETKYLFLVS